MFTNWLTGSSTPATRSSSSSSSSGIGGGAAGSGGSGGGVNASALVMSSPPDVILEVGPAPSSVRFVAHSLVLGMHSGYLRSAIRLDEPSGPGAGAGAAAPNPNANASATTATGELLLYLGNVTADQFAPLLTYMYTGYLDLTVDNIFAVLLATHVLHMPRAVEICRSFLARAQTEGYLNGNPGQLCPVTSIPAKVIRPIPSKATMPNFGFLPMPQAPMRDATHSHSHSHSHSHQQPQTQSVIAASLGSFGGSCSTFMDKGSSSPPPPQDNEADAEEDEDVEVFIDSNTATDNELDPEPDVDMECNVSVVSSLAGSSAGSLNIERLDVKPATPTPVIIHAPKLPLQQPKVANPKQREATATKGSKGAGKSRSRKSSSGLQVAKAPVPAAQLEMATSGGGGGGSTTAITPSKFIIDVASCDGPVRFRRILNTAYGHKPEGFDAGSLGAGTSSASSSSVGGNGSSSASSAAEQQHRSQQSVSYSFHQQMARAISSQQRQLSHQQQEESENSGDAAAGATPSSNGRQPATGGIASTTSSSNNNNNTTTSGGSSNSRKQSCSSTATSNSGNHELYVCVYCKHTFKSQYCYQKHAKRHLNPLSLTTADKKLLTEPGSSLANNLELDNQQGQSATVGATGAAAAAGAAGATAATAAATSALLRREVRPLDMNVQYYPCKTCGSKFPSYYFVHKHRKMCHADEIEATATSNTSSNNGSSNTSSSSSSNSSSNNTATTGNAKREVAGATNPGEDQQEKKPQQQKS
ncbi:cell wall protein AWA1 [Drosophila ficusphila]|uniref:cell wall protein AWA1 n=1 Tax=Drosophila ficusphila TaxID=30025 RepID=UPI0007E73270|nr:cell wall protein AWA1 [Drosophila ficusphila]